MASPKDILQLLSPLLKDWTFTSRINTLGAKTTEQSTPVTLPTDASALPVTIAGVVPDAGVATEATLALVATEATLALIKTKTDNLDVALSTRSAIASTQPTSNAAASQVDGHSATLGATTDADATANGSIVGILKRLRTLIAGGLPAALVGGRLDANNGAWLGSTAPTVGQKTMANSVPVVLASDQNNQTVVIASGSVVGQGAAGASPWLITVGVAATSLGKAEDAAAASGDTGVAVLAVRQDNPLPTTSDSGDYANLAVDPNGRLWVNSGAQNLEPQARLQNLLLSRQVPSPESFNGFVPSETPSFLVGG